MIPIVDYDKWVKDPEFYNQPFLFDLLCRYHRMCKYHNKRFNTLKRENGAKQLELQYYYKYLDYSGQVIKLLQQFELKK